MLLTIIVILLFILILYAPVACVRGERKLYKYWRQRGVATVRTNGILGFSISIGPSSEESTSSAIYAAEPNEAYVGIYDSGKPVLFIRDLELIHQVTVTDFRHFHDRNGARETKSTLPSYGVFELTGQEWETTKNKLLRTFSASTMKGMHGMIEDCADRIAERFFRPYALRGRLVAVKKGMKRFTLDVIGTCAFGLQFDRRSDRDLFYWQVAEILDDDIDDWNSDDSDDVSMPWEGSRYSYSFGMRRTPDQLKRFFTRLLRSAQGSRLEETEPQGDFVQLMLDLKERDNGNAQYSFTEKHIMAQMFTFYFAGLKNTSLTLTFALYELAKHPDVQDKLREEIGKAAEANGGILDHSTIHTITYLNMVIKETLRLHAPASTGSRICTETYRIPGSNLILAPGDAVRFPISAIHTDERYYPNPMEFDPERWSEENRDQMNPKAYIPFGVGPRSCLGMRFAELVIKVGLAKILSRFKVSPCYKTEPTNILKEQVYVIEL